MLPKNIKVCSGADTAALSEARTLVIMMGLQGSGKTSYVRRYLEGQFVHVNLDTLHTRKREQALIQACFAQGKSMVIDNTNPTIQERQVYILKAKEHGYRVVGIYMQSVLQQCIERNRRRSGKARVPERAIAATSNKLVLPDYAEGFDELFYVHNEDGHMRKEAWVK